MGRIQSKSPAIDYFINPMAVYMEAIPKECKFQKKMSITQFLVFNFHTFQTPTPKYSVQKLSTSVNYQ